MFFYLFSFFSQSNKTLIYNSDNFDNFIDLELGLSLSQKKNNNNFLPTIILQ